MLWSLERELNDVKVVLLQGSLRVHENWSTGRDEQAEREPDSRKCVSSHGQAKAMESAGQSVDHEVTLVQFFS